MSKFSLTRNFNGVQSLEGIQFQLGEAFAQIENYFNSRVDVYIFDAKTKNQARPTLKAGDLVFDLTIVPGVATLQQWDGRRLVPLNINTLPGTPGEVGPQGEAGPPAIGEIINFTAAEDIPAFSLVTAQGNIADSANLAHFNKVIGMTINPVASGSVGVALDDDEVTNGAWSWSPGDKFFLNGTTISLTPPSTGFSQMVAVARNPNIIIVKLGEAILL